MTNFHERYLAVQWFDITTPGLKIDYRSVALPTALLGPVNMRSCMYICVCVVKRVRACTCVCVRE